MHPADMKNWKVIGESYNTLESADIPYGRLDDVPHGHIDEMLSRDGQINPHWQPFMRLLDTLGPAEMAARDAEVKRLLRENGVTYVLHGEEQGHRPWELDPIPLILSDADWQIISDGLTQRAELLNLILADLYGARTLIKEGVIPPEIVYAHAGFLRACVGLLPTGFPLLLNYAADLARGQDGRLWILRDRTQAPSGVGYALENRTVLARALPNLFGEVGVHRLSFFFRALQSSIANLQYEMERRIRTAPNRQTRPHVVVLTPGPLNETYFEHAYLANYLGYTLAQGDDLTVSDGRVWLKSLGGLRPVDIIVRRVDENFCDPLELRQDSRLGVAGLLEVARQGNVIIINPPGSGVLENPGLIPFLPAVARHFLGEDLRIPSITTAWCGDPKQREYVLENLENLVIKTLHRHLGGNSVFGARLSTAELETLRGQIRAYPHLYVGQAYLHFSTVPSLIDGTLEPRRATFRCFLFSNEDGYAVMPGALTRCASERDELSISMQGGGVSKDTWILAAEPEPHVSLWQQRTEAAQPLGASDGLSSRAAENLFWVGRYAERAEGQTRLLRMLLDKFKIGLGQGAPSTFQDASTLGATRGGSELSYLRSMLCSLTGLTAAQPHFTSGNDPSLETDLLSILLDTTNSGSLVSTLQALVTAAYAVRDRWSTDTWRVMNRIARLSARFQPHSVEGNAPDTSILTDVALQEGELAALDQLMIFLSALSGLNAESMAQTTGWMSLDMGRRVERGLLLMVVCRSSLVGVQDDWTEGLLLESVLAAAESLSTYRRRYRSALHFPTALELLLLDEHNPRSLLYQLKRLEEHIAVLPREKHGYRRSEEEQLIMEALTQLQLSNTHSLAVRSEQTAQRDGLEKLLARLSQLLIAISDVLTQTYFSPIQLPQQLTTTGTIGGVR